LERYLFDLPAAHGASVLFVAQALGIVGLPIPDELLLTFAGGLVRRGDLRGTTTFAAAIAGSIAGTTLSYMIGRIGGRVLQHLPVFEADAIERAQSWFKRFGTWLLAFGCFVPGVRHVTAVVAGSSALDFRTFCAYAYPGVAVWAATFPTIGYFAGAGRGWEHAALLLRAHLVLAVVLIAVLAVGYAFVVGRTSSPRAGTIDAERDDRTDS
jgi:membrane protein DedA with SNARE-associated domain